MPLTNPVISQDSYYKYLDTIGVKPSKKLERCFSCGLPAVWLYLKAIGLEDVYFDLLKRIKNRSLLYKELFYLMILTNGHNKFFPHLPKEILKYKVPHDVAAAQVPITKPLFELTYSFTKEQLREVLLAIAKPNLMVRLGNQRKAIGIMFKDDVYHVYHAENPNAIEFKNVDGCVNLIMRVINERG